MPHPFTKKPLKSWDQLQPIDPHSLELKNSSKSKGRRAEELALQYFLKRGFKVLNKNQKYFGVEVDLHLFKDVDTIVEVKSLSSWEQLPFRVKGSQKKRLFYVQNQLSSLWNRPVLLLFAFVHWSEEVCILEGSEII